MTNDKNGSRAGDGERCGIGRGTEMENGTRDHDLGDEKETFRGQAKDFPRAFMRLMRNKAFMFYNFQIVCSAFIVTGVFQNMVRYIENHFLERAFVGSAVASVVSAFGGVMGIFFGGFLMSKLRLKPTTALKLVIAMFCIFGVGLIVIIFLACPQIKIESSMDPGIELFTVNNECNKRCYCSTSRQSYSPICGSDNLTYFSPCIAGCSAMNKEGIYENCTCISKTRTTTGKDISNRSYTGTEIETDTGTELETDAGTGLETDLLSSIGKTGRNGFCADKCTLLIPFAMTLFVMSIALSVSKVPSTIVSFRLVKDEERSFALGINSFAINLFGFIPAPMLFGWLIDQSCELWQVTCNTTGVCLLFDMTKFRQATYGVALVFHCLGILALLVVHVLIRNTDIDKLYEEYKQTVSSVPKEDLPIEMSTLGMVDGETKEKK